MHIPEAPNHVGDRKIKISQNHEMYDLPLERESYSIKISAEINKFDIFAYLPATTVLFRFGSRPVPSKIIFFFFSDKRHLAINLAINFIMRKFQRNSWATKRMDNKQKSLCFLQRSLFHVAAIEEEQ